MSHTSHPVTFYAILHNPAVAIKKFLKFQPDVHIMAKISWTVCSMGNRFIFTTTSLLLLLLLLSLLLKLVLFMRLSYMNDMMSWHGNDLRITGRWRESIGDWLNPFTTGEQFGSFFNLNKLLHNNKVALTLMWRHCNAGIFRVPQEEGEYHAELIVFRRQPCANYPKSADISM